MDDFETSLEIAQFLFYFEHSDDTVRMNEMIHSIMEKLEFQGELHAQFQIGFYMMHLYENRKFFEKMTLNLVKLNQIANKNFAENEWFIYTFYESIQFHFAHYAHIPKEKIYGIGSELKELYYRDNRHLSNFYEGQRSLHLLLGDVTQTVEFYDLFKDYHWSYLCADEAAYHVANVEYFNFMDQFDEALKSATLVLKTSKHNYQKRKAIQLILPLLIKLKDYDRAVKLFRKYIGMDDFNMHYYKLLPFYIFTRNLSLAIKTFEKNLLRCAEHFTDLECFEFYYQSTFLFQVLSKQKEQNIKLKIPSSFDIYKEDNFYEVTMLESYFRKIAIEIAEKLDLRNENDFYITKIKTFESQEEYISNDLIKLEY